MQAYFDKIVKGLAKKKIITFPDYVIMIQLWKIVFYESNKLFNRDLWRDFLNFPHFSKLVEPFMMK